MARGSAVPKTWLKPQERFGGGPPRTPPGGMAVASNGRVAIVMLMAAETMFFTGLLGAYLVQRGSAGAWPPPGQPRLPIGITWANTFVLFLSCWTMARAWAAWKAREARAMILSLVETALLGATFLAVQGSEWLRLLRHGLTVRTGVYGATFYTLIGVHGLHVLAAVAWLLVITARFRGNLFALRRAAGTDLCALYWFFVCGVWAVIFPLVYLF